MKWCGAPNSRVITSVPHSLQDTWPYDRIFNDQWDNSNTMKATYIVLGTNHDYFNTEWKAPESVGCLGFYKIWKKTCQLSVEQRQVAQSAIVAFFLYAALALV